MFTTIFVLPNYMQPMTTSNEILQQLKNLGLESYRNTMLKHGAVEPIYGVKIEEMKKLMKPIKERHSIAMELYDSGIYDAMYMAGLMAEPAKMAAKELQKWADNAKSAGIREYTVAWVAAESNHGWEKAIEWIKSKDENLAVIGWNTLCGILALKQDTDLEMDQLKDLLKTIAKTIHKSPNRVKYTMNSFVIALGTYVKGLNELAKKTGAEIGDVTVNMGDTSCKVPNAVEYIEKAEKRNSIGKKKKTVRC